MAVGDPHILGAPVNTGYAGMYIHENSTAFVISGAFAVTDRYNGMHGFTQDIVSTGWTFKDGKALSITEYATSDAGAKTQVNCGATGLANGDIVTIAGTTNYDGVYIIEQVVASTSFVIQKAWVADDGASTQHAASYLTNTNAASTGIYHIGYSTSATNATNNEVFEWALFQGTSELTNTEMQRKYATGGDYGSCSALGLVSYTAGNKIWLSVQNLTAANNITLRDCNVTMIRVL